MYHLLFQRQMSSFDLCFRGTFNSLHLACSSPAGPGPETMQPSVLGCIIQGHASWPSSTPGSMVCVMCARTLEFSLQKCDGTCSLPLCWLRAPTRLLQLFRKWKSSAPKLRDLRAEFHLPALVCYCCFSDPYREAELSYGHLFTVQGH